MGRWPAELEMCNQAVDGAPSYMGAVQSLAAMQQCQIQSRVVNQLNSPVSNDWLERAPASIAEQPGTLKAYIVEDNPLIRENLVETLVELLGIEVLGYAATEEGACDWLHKHPGDWQLLVIDLFLLQGSGLGVLRQCAYRNRRQRVVVLSNYATADIRSRCMASGADAVFDKSTELDQFLTFCAYRH